MAVPSTMSDLSTTAASNSPAGSEAVGANLDNYIRAHAAIIKQESMDFADGTSASKGSAKVAFLPAVTSAVATTVQAKLRAEMVSLGDRAVGDGATDDTAAIQAILDSGAKYIRGVPGKTYLISQAGTKTLSGTVNYFCLDIPSGVTLDLTGCTIKLADAGNAIMLINENAGTSQDSDITVIGGTWDGNETNQTAPATGEMPMIMMWDVLRPIVSDIKAKNGRDYFGRFLTCDQGIFTNLVGNGCDGDGWSFGVSGTKNLTNCFVDNIYAEDCRGTYGSLQGNPALFTNYRCNVGKVTGVNCAGGIKIQGPTEDSTYGMLVFEGGANGSTNSGIKVQGQSGLADVVRVSIGQAISTGAEGYGAYFVECVDCNVGQINSYQDGQSGTVSAFYVDSTVKRLRVNSANIQEAGFNSVDFRGDYISVGNLTVRNTGQVAGANRYGVIAASTCNGLSVGDMLLIDDQGTKTTERMFNLVSGATAINIDRLRCLGDTSTPGVFISNSATSELSVRTLIIDDTAVYVPASSTTQTGNIGTGEDDLCSVSLPARWGYKNGQGWKITAWGLINSTSNAKTIKLYFGSGAICSTAMTVSEASFWRIEAYVIRSSDNVQQYVGHMTKGATTFITDIERGQLTESEASAITVKVTGTATADNDIVNYALLVEPIK